MLLGVNYKNKVTDQVHMSWNCSVTLFKKEKNNKRDNC